MTKLRMQFIVDVEITSEEPWKELDRVKLAIERTPTTKNISIRQCFTHAMISEEQYDSK